MSIENSIVHHYSNSFVLAAWAAYRAQGYSASEADRLAGQACGLSGRSVRNVRKDFKSMAKKFPQLEGQYLAVPGVEPFTAG